MTRLPSTLRRWVAASAVASGCLAVVNAPPANALTSAACSPANGQSVTLLGDARTTTFVRFQQVSLTEVHICFNLPDGGPGGANAGVLVLRGGSVTLGGIGTQTPTGCAVPVPAIVILNQEIRLSLEVSTVGDPSVCVALNGGGIKLSFIAPTVQTPPAVELWLDPGVRVFPPSP